MHTLSKLALAISCLLYLTLPGNALAGTVEFEFDPDNFPSPAHVTNAYLPFNGGTLVFQGVARDECEISKQTIGFVGPTSDGYAIPSSINSVAVLVVRDQEWIAEAEDGECMYDTAELQEDTIDFYAQQNQDSEPGDGSAGTVWYVGEDTFALPDVDEGEGPACSTEGGWRADSESGGDVLAGILMLANPSSGDRYQQEFDEDNAEDMGAVLRTNGNVSIEFGEFTNCLVTREWTPLEPGSVEKKWYCEEQGAFPGGLALVEELKEKTLRVEYIGADLPGDFDGDGAPFPAFDALGCDDPNVVP